MLTAHLSILWAACIAAECATALVIYRRRAYTTYPAFFSLVLFMCANSFALATVSILHRPVVYFYVYWIGLAVRTIFIGSVMGELAMTILGLSWLRKHTLCTCMAASGVTAVLSILLSMPLVRQNSIRYDWDICALARTANEINSWTSLIVTALIFGLSLLCPDRLNVRMVGVALGLLIEFWIGSIAATAAALFGTGVRNDLNWVRQSAFIVTNCIWIASFLVSESQTEIPAESRSCSHSIPADSCV